MKRIILIPALAFLALAFNSCQKEDNNSSELDQKASQLESYVVNKYFVPVDFYSDTPIDYMEDDNVVMQETDLKKYIYPYLADDQIMFNADKTLTVQQNSTKMPGNDSATLTRSWSTQTSKSKNEVYLNYLDYFYNPRRYTLVEWTDTSILAYVDWTSKNDPTVKARLYTRFEKQN